MLDGRFRSYTHDVAEDTKTVDEITVRNSIILPHKDLKYSCKNEILM
jgi:hypothetical protein